MPACLDDYVDPDNPVRIIDAFVDELDLAELGFARVHPASTGRPGYAPRVDTYHPTAADYIRCGATGQTATLEGRQSALGTN